MEYRQLGNSDLQVSMFGLGGNTFGPPRLEEEMSIRCVHHALDLGVNFVDTADMYGQGQSEVFLGKALKGKRHQMQIATKFNLRNLDGETARDRIMRKCEESLTKLQTDHIDLYQVHFPNPSVSAEELLDALAALVKAGKVRYIGEVNFSSWRHVQTTEAARRLGLPEMVSTQNHYNLLLRQVEQEVLPMCAAYKVGFLPNQALAGGFLTDKYAKGEPPPPGSRGAAGSPMVRHTRTQENDEKQDQLKRWAHANGHTMGELAFAWLLSHAEVSSVLAGVSSPDQVEANVRAISWTLTPEEKDEVDAICVGSDFIDRVEGLGGGRGD
jgi:aryl-alcohol dehydrogenase-like predicted oxidoreductase